MLCERTDILQTFRFIRYRLSFFFLMYNYFWGGAMIILKSRKKNSSKQFLSIEVTAFLLLMFEIFSNLLIVISSSYKINQ